MSLVSNLLREDLRDFAGYRSARSEPADKPDSMLDPDAIALAACNAASDLYGFAAMTFGQDTAHLALLCVQPAQQRRGIATRMLEWLIESADVAGVASIDLELRADNAPALAFYRHMGFLQTQCIGDYYALGLSAHRMTRSLRPLAA